MDLLQQVDAAWQAFLQSMGVTPSTTIPWGQESYYATRWESFLLNWGQSQGRTISPVAQPGYQPQPQGGGGLPVGTRYIAAPSTGTRYAPPPSQSKQPMGYRDPRSRNGRLYGVDRHW